jgi:hypothetical protein
VQLRCSLPTSIAWSRHTAFFPFASIGRCHTHVRLWSQIRGQCVVDRAVRCKIQYTVEPGLRWDRDRRKELRIWVSEGDEKSKG